MCNTAVFFPSLGHHECVCNTDVLFKFPLLGIANVCVIVLFSFTLLGIPIIIYCSYEILKILLNYKYRTVYLGVHKILCHV